MGIDARRVSRCRARRFDGVPSAISNNAGMRAEAGRSLFPLLDGEKHFASCLAFAKSSGTRKIAMLRCAWLATLLLAVASTSSVAAVEDSELMLLVTMTRHGSRAPNPTVKTLCPNNLPNIKSYRVPLEQLTERGMQQLETTGRHVRELYIDQKGFLSSSFNSEDHSHFETYFRADTAQRCGQSAISLGYGLYPDGTGPKGYSRQPIPVYMQLFENEHDFTANGPCWTVMNEHSKHYATTRGVELIAEHASALAQLANICGSEFYTSADPVVAIKDVADMLLFDQDEGLEPTPGLTAELTQELNTLAFQQLIERLYTTPREITTAIGGFPSLLLRTLNDAAVPDFDPTKQTKYYSFHCHRELLHGLGLMMGMKFNFEGMPAYNGSTALHPGTTLSFELHKRATTGEYFVRLFVWSPLSELQAVKLDNCEMDCPLQSFNAIIQNHLAMTGPWQDICNYHPINAARPIAAPISMEATNLRVEAKAPEPLTAAMTAPVIDGSDRGQWLVMSVGAVACVVAMCATTYKRIAKRRHYQSI